MSADLQLESSTVEVLLVDIKTRLDPTAGAVSFQLSTMDVFTPVGSWFAGSWANAWSATTGAVQALTPPIGGANFTLTQSTRYRLWVKWTHSTETIVKQCATINAT
jgi:hypothetical protein